MLSEFRISAGEEKGERVKDEILDARRVLILAAKLKLIAAVSRMTILVSHL
jgi:hypothetical protein